MLYETIFKGIPTFPATVNVSDISSLVKYAYMSRLRTRPVPVNFNNIDVTAQAATCIALSISHAIVGRFSQIGEV